MPRPRCKPWPPDPNQTASGKPGAVHISRELRGWLRAHDRRAKAEGGCRLLVCRLPSRSPWLNPIEPKWVHGKRAVVEPARKLAAADLEQRLCAHYRCPLLPPLAQQVA